MKKVITSIVAFMFVIAVASIIGNDNVSAATIEYNPAKTLEYAAAHCNDVKEADGTTVDCVEFARTCVEAGGVPRDHNKSRKDGNGYTVEAYIKYLTDNGYAVLNKLTVDEVYFYGSGPFYYVNVIANSGSVKPGDIFVYKCTNSACTKNWFHVSVCSPADEYGKYANYYKCYAHNTAQDNKVACSIKHSKCGADAANMEMYALNIKDTFTVLDKPTSMKTTLTAYNAVKVSWAKVDNATGYMVQYKKSGSKYWSKTKYTKNNYYKYTGLTSGKQYTFKVTPYKDSTSNLSPNYESKSVYTLKKVTTPTIKRLSKSKVKVSWKSVSGATGYQVSKHTKKTKSSIVIKSTKNKSVTIKAPKGKKYYYKVRAYKTVNGDKIFAPWSTVKYY